MRGNAESHVNAIRRKFCVKMLFYVSLLCRLPDEILVACHHVLHDDVLWETTITDVVTFSWKIVYFVT